MCVGGTTGLTACSVTTGTIGSITATSSITVHPLPFENTTMVELKDGEVIQSITIYSSTGAFVFSKDGINSNEIEIGEDLAAGLYIVIVKSEKGIYTTRIIKIK